MKSKSKPVHTPSTARENVLHNIEALLSDCHEYETWVRDERFRSDWNPEIETEVSARMLDNFSASQQALARAVETLGDYLDGIDEEIEELRDDARSHRDEVEEAKEEGHHEGVNAVRRLIRRKLADYKGETLDAMEALLDEIDAL